MAPLMTTFDYAYALKVKLLLAAQGTPFQRNTVENLLPRLTLQQLGITYRRVPVVAIGRDLYADSNSIIRALQQTFQNIRTTPFHAAFEAYAASCISLALSLFPQELMTPERLKDRISVFPILARPDICTLKPSALAEWRCIFDVVENRFLTAKPGTFIDGDEISLANIHITWLIPWVLRAVGLEREHGFGEADWPGIYIWLAALPRPQFTEVDNETIVWKIFGSAYSAAPIGIDDQDPTGLTAGEDVNVESLDTKPGAHHRRGNCLV